MPHDLSNNDVKGYNQTILHLRVRMSRGRDTACILENDADVSVGIDDVA